MKYYLVQGPDGRTFQVQASSPEQALSIAMQALRGTYGATDLQGGLTVRDSSTSTFAPTTPALNFTNPGAGIGGAGQGAGAGQGSTPPGPVTLPSGTFAREAPPGMGGDPYGTEGAFQRALTARGVPENGPVGIGARGPEQFGAFHRLFTALTDTGLLSPNGPYSGDRGFESFVAATPSARQGASNAFNEIYRQSLGGNAANAGVQGFSSPTTTQGFQDATTLARDAFAGRYSPFLSGELNSRIGRYPDQYQAMSQTGPGARPSNFLDYLRTNLGLG